MPRHALNRETAATNIGNARDHALPECGDCDLGLRAPQDRFQADMAATG